MPLVLQLFLVMMSKYPKLGVDTFNTFWVNGYIKVFAWWQEDLWRMDRHTTEKWSLYVTARRPNNVNNEDDLAITNCSTFFETDKLNMSKHKNTAPFFFMHRYVSICLFFHTTDLVNENEHTWNKIYSHFNFQIFTK